MSDINLNTAECLTTMTNWGSNTVVNVCSGTKTVVEWGSMDYLGNMMIAAICITFLAFLVGVIIFVVKETFE